MSALLFLINLFKVFAKLYSSLNISKERTFNMGRKKVDRSDKVIQTFESSKPLVDRLKEMAQARGITVSALIRYILEHYFENREL
jgi:predicted DNA-binding ribbon-helix-helix protein